MKTRVVVWSTGLIGSVAIRAISNRPDLELVGVGVHSPDKAGKDAGELAGIGPVGVRTTASIDELIALRPDAVAYAGPSETTSPNVTDDVVRFLEAGINVSTTSLSALMWPPTAKKEDRDKLTAAAERGGASAYATGIEPGFAGDHLPLMLTMMSERIESIRVQEIFRYNGAPSAEVMKQTMGFGMPMEYEPIILTPPVQTAIWGPSLHKVAAHLGEALDEVRCTSEKRITERTLEVACGTIPAGTVGAMRFETIGMIRGREAIVIEHVNRMADDVAPDWPTAHRNGTYRVMIEGMPSFQCDLVVGKPETFSPEGRVATAMLMVNALPYLVEARSGLVSSLDLPMTIPQHVLD